MAVKAANNKEAHLSTETTSMSPSQLPILMYTIAATIIIFIAVFSSLLARNAQRKVKPAHNFSFRRRTILGNFHSYSFPR